MHLQMDGCMYVCLSVYVCEYVRMSVSVYVRTYQAEKYSWSSGSGYSVLQLDFPMSVSSASKVAYL